LDRRALPAPDLTSALAGGSAPATATEFTLAGIFSDVLGLPSDAALSIDDDFFRLGGHSLTATRVAARINAELGTSLTLREVFTTPTITGLAHLIDTTIATLDTTGDGATAHLSPVRIT
ncbi:phosphopantetheine-binding protein, partial [Rhodococcoides fascians]|uniref:phosphopantetheine-binding protein n=1 Tax=Rhodococcoides fascians TaxID=1828 RepID=UPI0018AF6A09